MQDLKNIIKEKKSKLNITVKPIENNSKSNRVYEQAVEFASYVNLKPLFIMKLFRVYGVSKVLNEKSWLKDIPSFKGSKAGLLIWRLKNPSQ